MLLRIQERNQGPYHWTPQVRKYLKQEYLNEYIEKGGKELDFKSSDIYVILNDMAKFVKNVYIHN